MKQFILTALILVIVVLDAAAVHDILEGNLHQYAAAMVLAGSILVVAALYVSRQNILRERILKSRPFPYVIKRS
ncbi:MAG: hypothetical protein GF384_06295 [Elusimicrobia bacterium]|nr:hypothetical protein [Elusimicrobiota bacterium]